MPSFPPPHLTTTEERLARLSVLQELTVMALDLFDPERSADPLLERLAERLGCLAAVWVAIEGDHRVTLVGAAGLSEASRALPISATPGNDDAAQLTLGYPELARTDLKRWCFRLHHDMRPGDQKCNALLVWFDPARTPPEEYIAAVERLVGVLETVLAHRRLAQDLRQSYEVLARTQLALVERERLAAIGQLAAVVAHEVRNPLAVIFNCIGALQKPQGKGDDAKPLLAILGEEANRLNQIVSELLDFARPDEVRMLSECLEDIVRGAVDAVKGAQATPIEIDLDFARAPRAQMLDARLMRRAVINLVTNAVQASPEGGRIVVRVLDEPNGNAIGARVEVIDEGPGIPASVRSRMFDPFFTTKSFGTGLGLSIVKHAAEAHHGEVTVHSTDGRGTTFTLLLPASTA